MYKEKGRSKCGQAWIPANGGASVLGVNHPGPRYFGDGHTSDSFYHQNWAQFVKPQSEIHHFQEVQCALILAGQATDLTIGKTDSTGWAVAREDSSLALGPLWLNRCPPLPCCYEPALTTIFPIPLPEDLCM